MLYSSLCKDDQPCRYTEQLKVTSISDFKRIDSKDEKSLRDAVGTVGPISVSVDASTFKLYKSGEFMFALSPVVSILEHTSLTLCYFSVLTRHLLQPSMHPIY